jgi:carbonic anhydrase/acetyltransferase-like protein (isoleucine patch superfamily)
MIVSLDGLVPQVDPTAYVQESARVIGDVHMGAQSSAWFNVVIRGDVYPIRIGARTNVQDNSVVHVTGGRHATILGDDVTIGHGVILHGCRIGNRVLVGIGAIVLDRCEIGDDCMIGAGSLLTPGTVVEPGHLLLGSPAKVVRKLKEAELAHLRESAQNYVANAERYRRAGI